MKKLLVAVLGAMLTVTGLVGVTSAPSNAAPYPGTVATNCHVKILNATTRGGTRIAVWVTTAGNGQPKGRFFVRVDRRKGGDSASDWGWYPGGRKVAHLGRLRPGVYDGNFYFNSKPARSVFQNCSQQFSFRVTRR